MEYVSLTKPVHLAPLPSLALATLLLACGSEPTIDDTSNPDGFPLPPDTTDTTSATDTSGSTSHEGSGPTPDGTGSSSSDGGGDSCLFCDAPNQACIDDQCVTTCQGQTPDPCGPDQVCDVQTGECRDPGAACTITGEYEACGEASCGPGSVCDEQGECIPVAPCADVVCLDDGTCWGNFCSCERQVSCAPPSEMDLNAAFSVEISDLEFADDCTAWMVTLRSGTDFLRRLTPDGTLTEWGGVSNLNMGEVKVLKSVTPPAGIGAGAPNGLRAVSPVPSPGSANDLASPPAAGVEGLGEVALTYTCCSTCGCFVDPPQGVARLEEDDPMNPLPLVVEATVTQGSGPFGVASADAGPFGLTWGIDRVLYVGNSTANGDIVTADLEMGTQAALGTLPGRITAGAPISGAHLLLAIEGGDVYRFNVLTLGSTLVTSLGQDVTSLSHDAFDGTVYVGLGNLDVVALDPWTGDSSPFATMPGVGRVTVSPNGQLWFSPVGFLDPSPIAPWDLPNSF